MDDAGIEQVQPAVRVIRSARIDALDAAGIAALLMLAWINLRWFDVNWDSIVYHLPFAALRTGLIRHSAFSLRPDLQERYDGFPPLADWVQGLLWRATGMPEATQLVSPIAIAAFAAYARWVAGVRMLWTVVIFPAIPITLTALNSANLDVWTNAFFCIYLLSALRLLRSPRDGWARHGAIGLTALAVAVNSKTQFFVLAPWALLLQGLATLLLAWRDAEPAVRRVRLRAVALMVAASPIVMATPIRNTVAFGNPVYPFHVQIAGVTLPGAQGNVWVPPRRLAGASQPALYLLSQLDFDAINMRFAGFSQDQGGQPEGADGNRMGGALSVLLFYSAGVVALALRRRWGRADYAVAASAAGLLAAVAVFPGSNELRYFCFVNILTSFAALSLVHTGARSGSPYMRGLRAGMLLVLVGSAAFTNFATGLRHIGWTDKQTLSDVVAASHTDQDLRAALPISDTICYIRPDSMAFLLVPIIDRVGQGRPYRVVVQTQAGLCPPGSALVQ